MKQGVEVAMQRVEEYAKIVLADIWHIKPEGDMQSRVDELEQRKIRLIIHYLFPQLTEWQRCLLICLFWEHSLLEN